MLFTIQVCHGTGISLFTIRIRQTKENAKSVT